MTLQLGFVPDTLTVTLVKGADFSSTLVNKDENGAEVDWPVTAVITLQFGDPVATTWTATIAGSEATFDEDKADVDTLIDSMTTSASRRVSLFYVDDPDDFCWAKGKVAIRA